ncbi:hypothetical protein SERLA73DRAFT_137190 [Serpula lacrymans var. lacrymans S7.3]|uniref:Uncharacterized protein n=2 Tax=Serpula lacrymans var. lacrymans TaxID=341189 RepID=F8PYV6_SERL3|nr:uncharacterized protein SERLADRAFT_390216 [Serpula lacrymans var. lacrymans S7.9]EGN99069.1 hypothetical protein SERLA73DRAFT_137190 [Serpula lacrymans var. lacrymans S7.3]EGO24643.1 hypothetical protein SERLADRAFT_390216 [Serpula lacrymans var. lacrymans S7.9]
MSVTHFYYDPFVTFDRLFDDAFSTRFQPSSSDGSRRSLQGFKPRMDLHENAESNTVTATFELPGLSKENVNIETHNDLLTISGESVLSEEHNDAGFAVRERSFGKFSRTLRLPQGTKPDDIKAKMENGVLTVTFPKVNPEQAPKRIALL